MAINFLDNVQFNQNQLLGARVENVPSDPNSGQQTGDIIYNTTSNILKYWNGTSFVSLTADTVLPTASEDTIGGVKLFSDTDQSVAANTVTTTASRTYGIQFNSSDQMVVNVPWSDTNTTDWILEGDTGNEDITASTKVKFVGGTNIATVASTGTGRELLTINLDDNVTLAGVLTVSGAGQSSFGGQVTIPTTPSADTDAASKAYVDSSIEGGLNVKGGFNASTGAIVSGGNLTVGATRVAVVVGDYYVVTVAGNFFGNTSTPLTPGDSVLVQTAAAEGGSTIDDFAVIQSDTDLATATNVGIGNVIEAGAADAAMRGLDVSYASGTASVGLDIENESLMTTTPADGDKMIIYDLVDGDGQPSNAAVTLSTLKTYFGGSTGVNTLLNSTITGITRTESGGITTFAITVSGSGFFGSGATAVNIKTEVLTAAGETVYAKVTRSAAVLSIAFVGSIANGDYRALLINVA
jgi:hypothetical protein